MFGRLNVRRALRMSGWDSTRDRVSTAEVLFTLSVVEHNLLFAVTQHAIKLFQEMFHRFRDSKTRFQPIH